MTELIGDIVITCTGGTNTGLVAGSAIPTANITVSLATNVTSRLASTSTGGASEALLLIDEPGSGLPAIVPGSGPAAAQNLCTNASVGAGPGGCVQFLQNATVNGSTIPVMSGSAATLAAPVNMFTGLVSGNQVTFNGIPVLAPVSSGNARVFRITNIRANVSGLGGGGLAGTAPLQASISISGSTSLPINNPVQVAGFIQAGLSTSGTLVRNGNNSSTLGASGTNFNQCNTQTTSAVSTLSFAENFGTAFKTRVAINAPGATNGQTPVLQNVPGTIYNSESGFVIPYVGAGGPIFGSLPSTGTNVIGLADFGTRLKATFNNVPTGVRIFVSVTNLVNNAVNVTTTQPAGTSTSSFAELVSSETAPEGSFVAPTASANSNGTALFEVPIVNGTATAVWEVINTNPAALETFNFGVYTSYSANVTNNLPPLGTATVNLSYAPTPTAAFSATAGSSASATLPIPRFADTSSAKGLLTINLCQTLLLFPFVTNTNGFDTGIAIANTSVDPVGTAAQSGTCSITFYDGTGKPGPFTTASIGGTAPEYVNLLSSIASGFQGYLFALCNFQYAHGFAFISDAGARNLAMGYLALVVNNGGLTRSGAPAAESLAH
jgi:hypothetical protein